jgi:hypothetical protein
MGEKKTLLPKKGPKIIDHDYCFWTSINELGEEGDYIYIYLFVAQKIS